MAACKKATVRHHVQYALITKASRLVKYTTNPKPNKEIASKDKITTLLIFRFKVNKKLKIAVVINPVIPKTGIGIPKGYA